MFKDKDVSALVQALKFAVDGDDVLATMTFYITPIRQPLAHQIHPDISDALFRRRAGDYTPRKVIPTMNLDLEVQPQSMSYALHRDIEQGRGLIPHVKIDKLRAMRLFTDNNDFTLAFDCHFPVNDQELMWNLLNRLKKPMLLTFKKLQGDLEFPAAPQLCEMCKEPATHRAMPSRSLACAEHIGAFVGEEIEPLDPDAAEAETKEAVQRTLLEAKNGAGDGKGKKKKRAAGDGKPKTEKPARKKKARPKK